LKTLEDFIKGSYDYTVVGGGLAGLFHRVPQSTKRRADNFTGLTVAGRISEDPNTSAAAIEAGGPKIGDPSVLTPAAFATLLGKEEYDWKFQTVPQVCIMTLFNSAILQI
jgi:choline dehydrogenase-like flavoprotein